LLARSAILGLVFAAAGCGFHLQGAGSLPPALAKTYLAGSAPQGLFEDRIYVLTPQASIVELPRGATPVRLSPRPSGSTRSTRPSSPSAALRGAKARRHGGGGPRGPASSYRVNEC